MKNKSHFILKPYAKSENIYRVFSLLVFNTTSRLGL